MPSPRGTQTAEHSVQHPDLDGVPRVLRWSPQGTARRQRTAQMYCPKRGAAATHGVVVLLLLLPQLIGVGLGARGEGGEGRGTGVSSQRNSAGRRGQPVGRTGRVRRPGRHERIITMARGRGAAEQLQHGPWQQLGRPALPDSEARSRGPRGCAERAAAAAPTSPGSGRGSGRSLPQSAWGPRRAARAPQPPSPPRAPAVKTAMERAWLGSSKV